MTPISKTDTGTAIDAEQKKRVGDILREARLALDKELPEIAKKLRIRLEFLEAIEENNPKNLPGTAYALGFVRSYASHLNLDTKTLVDQFKAEAEEIENLTELNFPEPLPAKSVPGGALVFIGLLLFALFYGLWYYLNTQGKSIAELVPALPDSLQQLISTSGDSSGENSAAEVEKAPQAPANEPEQTPAENLSPQDSSQTENTPPEPVAEENPPQETTAPQSVIEEVEAAVEEAEETEQLTDEATADTQDTATEIPGTVSSITNETSETSTAVETPVENTGANETVPDHLNDTTAVDDAAASDTAVNETANIETTPPTVQDGAEDPVETAENEVDTIPQQTASVPTSIAENLPTARPEPKIYGQENENPRVIITANATAWVEISTSDGNLLLTRLLNSGDIYNVPNIKGITLVTGNAGALEITVDGETVPAIGAIGAVVRDISLDPEDLIPNQ